MMEIQTINREEQLSLESEILRHLWYEGHATPALLSGVLNQSLPLLYDCLEDLIRRQCIYQFWLSPQGQDASVYCLTRRAHRKLQTALHGYSRYKLKSFWDAMKREQHLWVAHLQL
ncbi:MAG: hypothetical protein A2Z21_01150 [Candidatus Fraserbacteria bacterium RBG_16_55_9]|uniref:MarR family transcriptional regulator n=1 Tax=Fraserbacteria sp. (strain RBG_16_55_9) TaxID=1817864 RepID=A0A1F5UQ46_FRAXR|nr:MAG: hypothetical protein A2Z21_01150 [Candidatus Fraserbacteria bacterium RBG_16_55_9]